MNKHYFVLTLIFIILMITSGWIIKSLAMADYYYILGIVILLALTYYILDARKEGSS